MSKSERIGAKSWVEQFGQRSATCILKAGEIPGAKSDEVIYNERVFNGLHASLTESLPQLRKQLAGVKKLIPLVQAEISEQVDLCNGFFSELEDKIRADKMPFTDSWKARGETKQRQHFNASQEELLKQAEADRARKEKLILDCTSLQQALDGFIKFIEKGCPATMQPWDYVASANQQMKAIWQLVDARYSYDHEDAPRETMGIGAWINKHSFDELARMFSKHKEWDGSKGDWFAPDPENPFFILCKKHGISHSKFIPELRYYEPHYINSNASHAANKTHADAFTEEAHLSLKNLYRVVRKANNSEETKAKLGGEERSAGR